MDRTQWRAVLPQWERTRQHSYTQQCWSPHSLLIFPSSLLSVLRCSGQHSAIWTGSPGFMLKDIQWDDWLSLKRASYLKMYDLGKVISLVWDSGPPAPPFLVITANHGISRASQCVLSRRWGSRLLLSFSGHASVNQATLAPAVFLAPKMPASFKAKKRESHGHCWIPGNSFLLILLNATPSGPGETNNQFTSQQLAQAVSLHNLPWLSLALRMRS